MSQLLLDPQLFNRQLFIPAEPPSISSPDTRQRSSGTMHGFTAAPRLSLILLLTLVSAQTTPPPEESPPRVMPFTDAWRKSLCQPMEQLVDVEQEIPGNVEFIYVPPCVPLQRCSGCCIDESLECQPSLVRNITIELMRIVPTRRSESVQLTFVEHETCECRVRQKVQKVKSTGERIKKKPKSSCGRCHFPQNNIGLH